jgi:hypothetical protein
MQYGPDTAAVCAILERADLLTDHELDALETAEALTRGQMNLRLRMPRDYAWTQLHHAIDVHGLREQFSALWELLIEHPLHPTHAGSFVQDAACAAMLTTYRDRGPFTTSDYDTLLTPWRTHVEGCQRSRLALQMMSTWPHPAKELWPIVDAILAHPGNQRP